MLQMHNGFLRYGDTAISSRVDCIRISVLSMRVLTNMATQPLARKFVWRFLKYPLNPRIGKELLGLRFISWKQKAIG